MVKVIAVLSSSCPDCSMVKLTVPGASDYNAVVVSDNVCNHIVHLRKNLMVQNLGDLLGIVLRIGDKSESVSDAVGIVEVSSSDLLGYSGVKVEPHNGKAVVGKGVKLRDHSLVNIGTSLVFFYCEMLFGYIAYEDIVYVAVARKIGKVTVVVNPLNV